MGRTDKEIYRVIDNVNSYYRINSESKKELLLNKYPNAAAAYSLRLLDGYYRGPLVRVRRDDGVEVDVYPDYNNQLSLDSLVTNVPVHTTNDGIPDEDYTFQLSLSSLGEFVGATGYSSNVAATNATVCVWYDQSSTDGVPNDNDASQSVATSQPLIVSSGVIVTENGKPSLEFLAGDFMSNTTWDGAATTYVFNVLKSNGLETSPRIAVDVGSFVEYYGLGVAGNTGASSAGIGSVSHYSNGVAIGSTRDIMWGSMQVQNVLTVLGDFSSWTGGFGLSRSGQQMYTYAQEFIIYNSDQSTNRSDIEEDINSFYQIDGYTPTPKLIDLTQDLAVQNGGTIADGTPAAAYSLRLLSSTYNGPLVRIRRTIDNTEVDVYPDSDGEFSIYSTIEDGGTELTTGVTGGSTDKTTLHEFLYGQDTDCMVVVWYDQSGNANDATQTTAANQPKIYDSSTGVMTENGKPALNINGTVAYLTSTATTDYSSGLLTAGVFSGHVYPLSVQSDNDNGFRHHARIDSMRARFNITNLDDNTSTSYNGDQVLQILTFNGTIGGNYVNDQTGVTGSVSVSNTSSMYKRIGSIAYTDAAYTGNIQEIIMYDSDQSSNRTGIESNINTYYNIY